MLPSADLISGAVPVVVIDDPRRRLSGLDRGDDPLVVVVALGVAREAGQPALGGRGAVELGDRRDDRLEVCSSPAPAPAPPSRRGWQDRGSSAAAARPAAAWVVDQRRRGATPRPSRRPASHRELECPPASRPAGARADPSRTAAPAAVSSRSGTRGRRGRALLHELIGQLGLLAGAHAHVDSGLLRELRHQPVGRAARAGRCRA